MNPGLSVALDREATTIGRSSENDFVLDSAAVSKNHARVLRENGVFYVEDMGSTNGLRVNGRPLAPQERRVLCHGDSIELANHVILFCHHGTFSDRTGLSSIQVDRDHVRHAADKLLAEVPGIKRPAT
jgi:pSer/pThr/pTyr-binding forkhead associated (FHA) protein